MKLFPPFKILVFFGVTTFSLYGVPMKEIFEQRGDKLYETTLQQTEQARRATEGLSRTMEENNFSSGKGFAVDDDNNDSETTELSAKIIDTAPPSQEYDDSSSSTGYLMNNRIGDVPLTIETNPGILKAESSYHQLASGAAAKLLATPQKTTSQKKSVTFSGIPMRQEPPSAKLPSKAISSPEIASLISIQEHSSAQATAAIEHAIANVRYATQKDDENIIADEWPEVWRDAGPSNEEWQKDFDQRCTAALTEIQSKKTLYKELYRAARKKNQLLENNNLVIAHARLVKASELTEKAFAAEAQESLEQAQDFREAAEQYEKAATCYDNAAQCYHKIYDRRNPLEVEMEREQEVSSLRALRGRVLSAAGTASTLAAKKMEEVFESKAQGKKGNPFYDQVIIKKYQEAAGFRYQAAEAYKQLHTNRGNSVSNAGTASSRVATCMERAAKAKKLEDSMKQAAFLELEKKYQKAANLFIESANQYNMGNQSESSTLFEEGKALMKTLKTEEKSISPRGESESIMPDEQDIDEESAEEQAGEEQAIDEKNAAATVG